MRHAMFVNHVHLLPATAREDATCESFLRLADKLDIERAIVFAPFHWFMADPDFDPNQWLADEIRGRENLVGYGVLNSKRPADDQVRQMVELGFKGVKLHPAVQDFALLDDWAREAYAAMQEHGLVADFHTGIHGHRISETCDPVAFDQIAQTYPDLHLVFEHIGGWHFFREMVGVMANNRRKRKLYAGVASVLDRENQRYWYLGPEGLNNLYWQTGPDLMVYGLDFPYNQEAQIRRDLEIIADLPWPDEDRKGLLGGNLMRLLGMVEGKARLVGGDPVPNATRS